MRLLPVPAHETVVKGWNLTASPFSKKKSFSLLLWRVVYFPWVGEERETKAAEGLLAGRI